MKKTLLTLALAIAGTQVFAGSGEIRQAPGGRSIADQFIVVLNPEAAPGGPGRAGLTVSQAAVDLATRHGGSLRHVYEHGLKGFAIRMPEAAARALARDPRVDYVEQDSVVYASDLQGHPPSYGLDRIDQHDLPLDQAYHFNRSGAGVHAYIIDSGIRASHQDFGGRVGGGFTAINDGNGTGDCLGHGTHVAGTVGGASFGVAKQVTLHPVRVFGCTGQGSTSDVIAGVNFVTGNHESPAVANMSLGGSASDALDDAVRQSIDSGVTYAIAAGNFTADACSQSPARVGPALTVGSSTSTDARSSFSNFGSCLDLFAPGSDITSAWFTSDTATNTISGTSMATPHVTGVAALILEDNPGLAPAQVAQMVVDSATPGHIGDARPGSPNLLLFSPFGGTPPPPAGTRFFEHIEYVGDSFAADGDLAFVGWEWNDRISSLRVAPGKRVTLYEHADFGGASLTVTGDVIDLRAFPGPGWDGTWNDAASSMRVTDANQPPPEVTFFDDIGFGGGSFAAAGDLSFVGWEWNDRISSILIPPGRTVVIYEHSDFGGASLVLTGNQVDLRAYPGPGWDGTWNDAVSSIKIF